MSELLDAADWQGRIYSDGWRAAHGGVLTNIEPATGDDLAQHGPSSSVGPASPAWPAESPLAPASIDASAVEIDPGVTREGTGLPHGGQLHEVLREERYVASRTLCGPAEQCWQRNCCRQSESHGS